MRELFSPVVLRNLGSLLSLQIGNYLIPLLLVPYLLRVLGFDLFGTLMFSLAFVVVARVCVSYGFDLTATRQVAVARDSGHALSQLVADVVGARMAIWLVCAALLSVLSLVADQIADVRLLILIGLLTLLGEAAFPVYLYQGMERMAAITQARLGAKFANLLLVFLLVKGPGDVMLVPLIEAITTIVGGGIALAMAVKRFKLELVLPSGAGIGAQLRDGWPILVSTMAVQLYTTANSIVLGVLVGPQAVGAYSVAEKVYSALRGLLSPVVQAIFPVMARLHDSARPKFSGVYRGAVRMLVPTLIAVGLALFIAAPWLVAIIAGEPQAEASNALRVFAIAFPFAMGSFLAPMLVVQQKSSVLMRITLIGGGLALGLSPLLTVYLGAVGAAATFLAVQIYNTAALLVANRAEETRASEATGGDR